MGYVIVTDSVLDIEDIELPFLSSFAILIEKIP